VLPASEMSSIDLENVEPHAPRADSFTLDIERPKREQESLLATDHYEILRVGQHADEDTIERVYRTLADRFHPDNPLTGDAETFRRLKEAYETLSNHDNRAKYNVLRQYSRRSAPFGLRGREFFDGVRGGQNRRLALLCLLYRQRTISHEFPGLTVLDLEQLTGCTREEVTAALWYLCAKHWASLGEFTSYSITAAGFDFVESKLEDRLEFRALATTRYYYRRSSDFEGSSDTEPRYTKDTLPLDIEPAITSEGNVSIADHYEIFGLGPQADEEAIERVYRTLAGRFHPDNPSTGDAKTFARISEAYETLSDPVRRTQYNARRQRSKYSDRFRLRAREFFEGIKGEQLRRLAVLCLLYRQAACEGPGLTVLDLEQLTGCTREELGSPLWYLREKNWAHFGEFTEYSITAAGFDVVENKLDDREPGSSQTWRVSEDTRGSAFEYPDGQNPQNGADTPRYLIASGDSNGEPTDIEAEKRPEANEEVARGLIQLEEAFDIAEQDTRPEVGAESPAPNPQSTPATPLPVIPRAITAPEIRNLQNAGISATDIFQHLLRLQNAGEASEPAWSAEPAMQSQQTQRQENRAVMPQSVIENTVDAPEKQPPVAPRTPQPQPLASATSVQSEEGEPENINRGRPLRSFVRKLFGFDGGAKPSQLNNRIYQLTPEHPIEQTSESPATVLSRDREGAVGSLREQPAETESTPVPDRLLNLPFSLPVANPMESTPALPSRDGEGAAKPADIAPKAEENAPAAPVPGSQTAARTLPEEQPAPQSQPIIEVTSQSPGVTDMGNSTNAIAEQTGGLVVRAEKRVIFSMGGKGGVGKTSVMTGLAEWFDENQIPVALLDLDTENKACGSLTHFFTGRVPKINIHTPAGLDAFIDHLGGAVPVILADMGAGAGQVTHEWFDTMYPDMAEFGVVFTAIGVVTPDPASVESVLNWSTALQDRVDYVIVENNLIEHADFTYWRDGELAKEFQRRFHPAVIKLDNRLAELENAARNYGATMGKVARRATGAPELQKASLVMRAQSYRRRMFSEFDKVKELLLP
jgi:curved DNA-binding protein CbpA